jgi:hypothetical protein
MMKVEVKNMVYSNITTLKKIEIIKAAIDKADAIIIGAGASFSRTRHEMATAGLACDNAEAFNTLLFF